MIDKVKPDLFVSNIFKTEHHMQVTLNIMFHLKHYKSLFTELIKQLISSKAFSQIKGYVKCKYFFNKMSFFKLLFDCSMANFKPFYSWRDSLTNLMLITAFLQIQPEGHQVPCHEVGSLSPAKHLKGFTGNIPILIAMP